MEATLDTAEIERVLGNTIDPQENGVHLVPPTDTSDNKRETLIRLAEGGDIDKPVAYIKKASKKIIDKLHEEHERKQLRRTNEFITDAIISKFSDTLGGLDAIESSEELTKELEKDELLRRDVYRVVETLSPYIPFIGFVSGGITTIKHVYNHKGEGKEAPPQDQNPS